MISTILKNKVGAFRYTIASLDETTLRYDNNLKLFLFKQET